MWQEFIRLRETYLEQAINKNDVYRTFIRNQFLFEMFKLGGNTLPEIDFISIIGNDKRPHGPSAKLKAYDLWKAWQYTNEKASQHIAFTPELIQGIASKVMKHTGAETTTTIGRYDTSLGDFRLGEDYNAVYPIADYCKIPDLLTALCRKVKVQLKEFGVARLIKTAIDYLYEFAHIKPFGEGNIETGMLSMNYLLLYHQQPLLIVFAEDKPQALNAIKSKDMTHTSEAFEAFMLQEQIKFLHREIR